MINTLLYILLSASAVAQELPTCDFSNTGRVAYLMTVASAPQADRAFGHTGLVVYDPQYGLDSVLYDFGTFDGSDPVKVVTDLITGQQIYSVSRQRMGRTIQHYGDSHGREVMLQELRLTERQWQTLGVTLFEIHRDKPEFAYNWYYPNCTTRARDVLDDLLGGQLKAQHQGVSGTSPARQVLRHSVHLIPMWFGLHWGSGALSDQDISWWDAMFLPATLAQRFEASTVSTPTGEQPFVVNTCIAAKGRTAPIPAKAPNYDLWLWMIGVFAGLGVFGLGRTRAALATVAAQGMAVGVFGCAALFVGVMGTFAPFWTHHNLYFANPLHLSLIAAALIAWRRPKSLLPERIAMALVAIGGLGVLISLVGGLADRNFGIFGLMLPIGIAAAATLNHRRRKQA